MRILSTAIQTEPAPVAEAPVAAPSLSEILASRDEIRILKEEVSRLQEALFRVQQACEHHRVPAAAVTAAPDAQESVSLVSMSAPPTPTLKLDPQPAPLRVVPQPKPPRPSNKSVLFQPLWQAVNSK